LFYNDINMGKKQLASVEGDIPKDDTLLHPPTIIAEEAPSGTVTTEQSWEKQSKIDFEPENFTQKLNWEVQRTERGLLINLTKPYCNTHNIASTKVVILKTSRT
jgi:hypothetical protein